MISGFFITLTAIRRQLAAMPNELYFVRPIHGLTGRPCAGERLWWAGLLTMGPAVGFLRARNREGFDIYLSPFAMNGNASCSARAATPVWKPNRLLVFADYD